MKQVWQDWADRMEPVDDAEAARMLIELKKAYEHAPAITQIPLMTRVRALPEIIGLMREVDIEGGMTEGARKFFHNTPPARRENFVRLMETLLPDEPADTPGPEF